MGSIEMPWLIEVRLNAGQVAALDRAVGSLRGQGCMRASWYRLGLERRAELEAGKPVIFTLPSVSGGLPRRVGAIPDLRAEWLPVFIHALEESGQERLADMVAVVYEAIEWGMAAEIYLYDGIFDLATISGRKRLKRREVVMKELHGLPALPVGQKLEKEA